MGVYGSGQTLKQFDGSATSFHTAALIAADAVQVGTAGDLVPLSRLATAIQPVVLYNGGAALDYDTAPGAGTNGTVTLSETAANFSKLIIYYTDDSDEKCTASTIVPSPNGRGWCGQISRGGATQENLAVMAYSAGVISNKTITKYLYGRWLFSTNGSYADRLNTIRVIRVEGIR
jgi:hypothetical protein